MDIKQNKIMLFGADGYIGTKLSRSLSVKYKIIQYSVSTVMGMKYFDLMNPCNSLDDSHISGDDIAVFMAAVSSPDVCENDYETAYQINVTGTKYIIEKLLGKGVRVVFFSSDTVYGADKTLIYDESSPKNPFGAYGKMKSSVEDEFLQYPGFLTLRLSYIFSFEDKFTKYLLSNSNNGKKEIYHPFSRSVVYIEDLVDAIISIINKWPKINIINICGDSLISRVDIANNIKELVNPKLSFNIINPGENFFSIRPPIIQTRSLYLQKLLGRNTYSLKKSINIEKEIISYEN